MNNYDFLKDKIILITGGAGSFGQKFVEWILKLSSCKKIIIFSRDELKHHQMRQKLFDYDKRLRFFLGDVRDLDRLRRAFSGVDIVVHAAALKQVPTLEYNPFEAVKTNIIGSQNVIDAAIDRKVSKVLLISTDKAAHPVNLYGSTKLCAEKLFIAGNAYSPGIDRESKFSAVRYGNIIGSRGSIVETLLNNNKNSVQITHTGMTRFWINLDCAFDLVLFALNEMEGGEIFVPKIPSMKLTDLFDVLAPNVKREIVGIRPGEKIHETLLTVEEAANSVEFDKHFIILPDFSRHWTAVKRYEKYLKKGKKIKSGFCLASDTNKDWLTKNDLKNIIRQV